MTDRIKGMDHLSIPIPDGMDDAQKAELAQWLALQAAEAVPESLPLEGEPHWQAETAEKIRQGLEDVKAGRTRPAKEVLDHLAQKYGLASGE